MSYCECDYDYDQPQFYSEGTRKARKTHRCCECGGPIHPGMLYVYRSGKWDSGVETFKECFFCAEVRRWATISMECFCANMIGELHEKVREMLLDVGHQVPGWSMEYGRRAVRIIRRGGTRLETRAMRQRKRTILALRTYDTPEGNHA